MITIWVALITGAFALLPNILNNRQQLKLKKIEVNELAKRQAIIEFSDTVSECVNTGSGITVGEGIAYQKAVNKLLLYFPDIDMTLITKLNQAVHDTNMNSKQDIIRPLIKELSKSLSEIK